MFEDYKRICDCLTTASFIVAISLAIAGYVL